MKKYNIKVNGSLYQVEVEEVSGNGKPKAASKASDKGPTNVHDAVMSVLGPGSDEFGKLQQNCVGDAGTKINAPMPGKILDVRVSAGQHVNAGDILVILEAMKMENEILAPAAGMVASVNAAAGTSVNVGDLLVVLE